MKYIDIHCHLDSEDFDSDREAILVRMKEEGVATITIGTDLESSKRAIEIAEANENVWATIGMHPDNTSQPPLNLRGGEQGEGVLEELVKSPKVVAIGECGLDYFRLLENVEEQKNKQKELFIEQIEFAVKHNKPLMLHCREAYDDALDILESYQKIYGEKLKGNSHFFAGNIKQAKRFLDLGFTMSFTGVITFLPRRSSAKAGTDLDEVIKYLPQNSIMSETDAPWVAPVPFRGKRNEPVYVLEVVKKLAEIRGEDFEDLNNAILKNAERVFLN